jgi:hypothetical protein
MPEKHQKYQEEIEEILRGLEEKAPANPLGERGKPLDDLPRTSRQNYRHFQPGYSKGWNWASVSPGKLALLGLIILLLGAIWLRPLIWVGLGILAGAYLLFFVKPRSMSYEKRWRGQALENSPSPWERFKRWLKS